MSIKLKHIKVSMNNFAELSGCVFTWIEDQCKPGDLQEILNNILRQVCNNIKIFC